MAERPDLDQIVYQLLTPWIDVPEGGIQPDHELIRDLHIYGDDFSMSFFVQLRRRLRTVGPLDEWNRVRTVRDVLALVHRYASVDPGTSV